VYLVDETRVRLMDGDPDVPGSDYINANHITVFLSVIIHMLIITLKCEILA